MSKVIPALMYREHCISQGRDGIKSLTRKQKKALRQHNAATGKREGVSSFKASSTIEMSLKKA